MSKRDGGRLYARLVKLDWIDTAFHWELETKDGERLEGRASISLAIAVMSRLLELFTAGAPVLRFKPKEGDRIAH